MKTFLGFRGSSSIGPAADGAVFYVYILVKTS